MSKMIFKDPRILPLSVFDPTMGFGWTRVLERKHFPVLILDDKPQYTLSEAEIEGSKVPYHRVLLCTGEVVCLHPAVIELLDKES